MDKTKAPPIPEKTQRVEDKDQGREGLPKTEQQQAPEPSFVRGTIEPPTKK